MATNRPGLESSLSSAKNRANFLTICNPWFIFCRVGRVCRQSPPPQNRATFTAHGSSKPGWSSCSRFLVRFRQTLVNPSDSLLTFPLLDTHCASVSDSSLLMPFQGRSTCLTSARFHVGYGPIQRVMYSPCLSAAGLRFLRHPVPTEDLALPYGWATAFADLIGVFLFRLSEIRLGWVPTIPRSLWCIHSDV